MLSSCSSIYWYFLLGLFIQGSVLKINMPSAKKDKLYVTQEIYLIILKVKTTKMSRLCLKNVLLWLWKNKELKHLCNRIFLENTKQLSYVLISVKALLTNFKG